MERSYTLVDAIEMHRKHPKTFEVPTEKEIISLQVGDTVKLCFNGIERIWVTIIQIVDVDHMVGKVDNDPVLIWGLSYQDRVEFSYRNIYQIYS